MKTRYFLDCEFDSHGGALLSMALVTDYNRSLYITTNEQPKDPWVIDNVVLKLDDYSTIDTLALSIPVNKVGFYLRSFIRDKSPLIVADSPVDIGRLCQAISTDPDGNWQSTDYPSMTFLVENVDCYPTTLKDAIQHNAWHDARALRQKLMHL